jgi:YHS domain-containing protein
MAKDPVCGMLVDEKETEFKTQVRGRLYYFCSEYCRHIF